MRRRSLIGPYKITDRIAVEHYAASRIIDNVRTTRALLRRRRPHVFMLIILFRSEHKALCVPVYYYYNIVRWEDPRDDAWREHLRVFSAPPR